MRRHNLTMSLYRSDPLGGRELNRPPRKIEEMPSEIVQSTTNHAEASNDNGSCQREEEVERCMKNIKEFIRGIDVKAL